MDCGDTILKSEHLEQVEFVSWFKKNYMPEHRIFAIPNGGLRNKMHAMALKAEGASAGVPDLFIPSMKIFIEMKREKGGKASEEQTDWINYLNSNGYTAVTCQGFEEAKAFISSMMKK